MCKIAKNNFFLLVSVFVFLSCVITWTGKNYVHTFSFRRQTTKNIIFEQRKTEILEVVCRSRRRHMFRQMLATNNSEKRKRFFYGSTRHDLACTKQKLFSNVHRLHIIDNYMCMNEKKYKKCIESANEMRLSWTKKSIYIYREFGISLCCTHTFRFELLLKRKIKPEKIITLSSAHMHVWEMSVWLSIPKNIEHSVCCAKSIPFNHFSSSSSSAFLPFYIRRLKWVWMKRAEAAYVTKQKQQGTCESVFVMH